MRPFAEFAVPDPRRGATQLGTTLVLALGLQASVFASLSGSAWLTLVLALPAGAVNVRLFILAHDCSHGSLFARRRTNDLVGLVVMAVFHLTPYHRWRRNHVLHHASAGNLARRGAGDLWLMTVEEYRRAPRGRRLAYRLYRSPVFLLVVGPLVYFTLVSRLPRASDGPRERSGLWATNLVIGLVHGPLLVVFQDAYLLAVLPALAVSSALGVWLFNAQHYFERGYWKPPQEWSFVAAGLRGSSYLVLPRWLGWITADIGFHHVHHLEPRVPNHGLARCHRERAALFTHVPRLGLLSSVAILRGRLWDEAQGRMVPHE